MKKRISLILACFFLLSSLVSCTKSNGTKPADSTDSDTTPAVTTPSVTDPVTVDFTYDTWLSDGHVKVMGEQKLPDDAKTEITVNMAKNEKEAFNLSIRTDASLEGLTLVLLEGDSSDVLIEYFDEYLINTGRKKHYPDPLVPYTDGFAVEDGVTKTLMVRFASNKDTKSGEREFKFAVVYGSKTLAEYDVTLNVWNFALPETLTCESAVGMSESQIFVHEKTSGATSGKW